MRISDWSSDVCSSDLDNSAVLIALCGLAILLVFCFLRWRQVGRDPHPGVVVVHYDPPEGYSPADLRYVKRMQYDNRCFSSNLLLNAVEGLLRIRRDTQDRKSVV